MELPANIRHLANKNAALLEKMNFTPNVDDPLGLNCKEAYKSTGLFTVNMLNELFDENDHVAQREMKSTIPTTIGMILVRPDMLHASAEFEAYVSKHFKVIHAEDIEVGAESYWNIYRYDLSRPEALHSRLTRAAIYIGSTCRLFVFKDQNTRSLPAADYARNTLRGTQGVYEPGTLRGDIVYRNAIQLNLHRLYNTGVDERIKIATDPFTSYRYLANKPSGPHTGLAYPLLFYTGVGVHVPDATEVQTDLTELITDFKALVGSLT